jgi:hypothetical protein
MKTINQKAYPGDMTEAQAELLLSLVPPAKEGGRPRSVDIVSLYPLYRMSLAVATS